MLRQRSIRVSSASVEMEDADKRNQVLLVWESAATRQPGVRASRGKSLTRSENPVFAWDK
jgi:hypothetical protein